MCPSKEDSSQVYTCVTWIGNISWNQSQYFLVTDLWSTGLFILCSTWKLMEYWCHKPRYSSRSITEQCTNSEWTKANTLSSVHVYLGRCHGLRWMFSALYGVQKVQATRRVGRDAERAAKGYISPRLILCTNWINLPQLVQTLLRDKWLLSWSKPSYVHGCWLA